VGGEHRCRLTTALSIAAADGDALARESWNAKSGAQATGIGDSCIARTQLLDIATRQWDSGGAKPSSSLTEKNPQCASVA
jgi:hypothetical protein